MVTVRYEKNQESRPSQMSQQIKDATVEIDDGINEEIESSSMFAHTIKKSISPFVMSFGFRLFGVVLIFVDLALMILSLLVGDKYRSVDRMIGNLSLAIAFFFFIDVILRVCVEGFRKYFSSKLNILDCIIVVGTLMVNIFYSLTSLNEVSRIPRTVIIFRVLRIVILVRIFRLASEAERLEKVTRRMSKTARKDERGQLNSHWLPHLVILHPGSALAASKEEVTELLFNQDGGSSLRSRYRKIKGGIQETVLIWISLMSPEASENRKLSNVNIYSGWLWRSNARVIAMSFPSSGQQSFYRNPIKEVAKFLDTKHPDHYKVYNLCSEQGYDPKFFHYRVERIFIDDHNVPTLEEMLKFTSSVRDWMEQDNENIIAIHCKGGKGRTGTLVCVWLIDNNQFESAQECLEYFGERRTDKSTSSKFQGVETPSQNRYVEYYEKLKFKYDLHLPPVKPLRIKSIKLYAINGVGKSNGSDLRVKIIMEKEVVFHCICATQENCRLFLDGENDWVIIGLEYCPVLMNDVKVRFESSVIPKGYDDCAFFFWFHTAFVEDNRLYIPRNEIDNLHKPRMWKSFRETFAVELNFTEP